MSFHEDPEFGAKLKIPVNPEYDHDVDPEENPYVYWNPVSAVNDLIKLANAAIEVSQNISDWQGKKASLEVELRSVTREIEALERFLIRDSPLSTSESKTLKTVDAAVESRAVASGHYGTLEELRNKEASLKSRILVLKEKIDCGYNWNKTNERVSDNIKTALAFYKDERRRA